MAISEAIRLLAPGADVTLGGKAYPLIFDFEALCVIEEEMGGLDVFAQRLLDKKQRLRTIRTGMLAGLVHTGLRRAEILKQLQYADAKNYLAAMTEAFMQALPEPEPSDPKAGGSPDGSLGGGTTTSPQSPLVEAMTSSGA